MIELTDENIQILLVTFFDGFASGFSTAAINTGMTRKQAEHDAELVARNAFSDPAVRDTIIENFKARLAGKDGTSNLMSMHWWDE